MTGVAGATARFEGIVRVRFDEAGADGLARPSTLLRLAQDVAWQHGTALGLDRDWYQEHRLVWLVRAVDLAILQPIPVGARLRLATAVVGHRRIWARRRVEIQVEPAEDVSPAAVALTDWVLTDATGRIVRITAQFAELFAVPPATFELTRVPIGPIPDDARRSLVAVRPHELDPNGHVNNAVLLDWLDEAVPSAEGDTAGGTGPALRVDTPTTVNAGMPGAPFVARRYLVEYLAPLEPGARVELAVWRRDGRWLARLARPEGGPEVARASLGPA